MNETKQLNFTWTIRDRLACVIRLHNSKTVSRTNFDSSACGIRTIIKIIGALILTSLKIRFIMFKISIILDSVPQYFSGFHQDLNLL